MSLKVGAFLAACLALTAGVAIFAAPMQNRPGEITPPHVWIENREASDAIPVAVQSTGAPMRVLVTGLPSVTIDPANTLPTRLVRQSWDYRTIAVPNGQDPASLLVAAGNDGWEVAGVLQQGQTSATILLKRPR
jgi:hypothetical protein